MALKLFRTDPLARAYKRNPIQPQDLCVVSGDVCLCGYGRDNSV